MHSYQYIAKLNLAVNPNLIKYHNLFRLAQMPNQSFAHLVSYSPLRVANSPLRVANFAHLVSYSPLISNLLIKVCNHGSPRV